MVSGQAVKSTARQEYRATGHPARGWPVRGRVRVEKPIKLITVALVELSMGIAGFLLFFVLWRQVLSIEGIAGNSRNKKTLNTAFKYNVLVSERQNRIFTRITLWETREFQIPVPRSGT